MFQGHGLSDVLLFCGTVPSYFVHWLFKKNSVNMVMEITLIPQLHGFGIVSL